MLVLALTLFRPVPSCNMNSCLSFTGTVQNIFEGGDQDIVIVFYDTERKFYINRGLEKGFTIENLNFQMQNQEVTVYYPRYWTPLDPAGNTKHLTILEFNGRVLFDENC